MLKKEGKINDAVIENMLSRRHAGFHVHIGARIRPEDETALGNLAKYIVRASFSQKRMLCIPAEKAPGGTAKVVYTSKDGKTEQTFDAIDRLARLVVHIPNKYEQLVRYVGFYSNKSRDTRNRDPPPEEDSHISELVCDDSDSRIPQYDYRERIPRSKKKRTLGSAPNCGRKKAVSHVCRAVSDFPQTIFNPSTIFARSPSDSTTTPGNT